MLENQSIELLVHKLQETYPQNRLICIITVDPNGQFDNRKSYLSALSHILLKMPPATIIFLPDSTLPTMR